MMHFEKNYMNTSSKEHLQNKDDEDEDDNDAVSRQADINSIYCNYNSSLFQERVSPWAWVIKDGNKVWRLTPEVLSYIQYLEEYNILKIECSSIIKSQRPHPAKNDSHC